jgi:putative ABC transport system permease protein
LRGELVVLSPQTRQITSAEPFPRRLLTRAKGHPDVEEVTSLYMGMVKWKDPDTGEKRPLFVYGVVPYAPALSALGAIESTALLRETDTCLFDIRSRREFGQVAAMLAKGRPVDAEVNGLRHIKVVGTTTIGANFAVDGNVVTSDANFSRMFPGRPPGSVDVGVVRLRAGAEKEQVKTELRTLYGSDLLVLTIPELIERETDFLLKARPINFVFTLGAAVGFLVGFAIVYQVLFTEDTFPARSWDGVSTPLP